MRLLPLALTMLSGCAHFTAECAAHGGPPWYEVTSTHFVVRTNLDLAAARQGTVELERARAALLHSFKGVPEPGRRLEVLLLRNNMQVQDLAHANFIDGAVEHDWRGPLMVLSGDAYVFESNADLSLLLHGLARHLEAFSWRRSPRWLDDGLARYLETLTIDPATQTAFRGKMSKGHLEAVRRWGVIPLEELWAWDGSPERLGLELHRDASAWFWVHFLFNEHRPAFERFLQRLETGEEPRQAFATELGDLSTSALEEAVEKYLFEGRFSGQLLELSPVPESVSDRPLPDAEVHAALARGAAVMGQWERARHEALAAVALDAHAPRALEEELVTERDTAVRVAGARRLTTLDPGNATGWLVLALGLDATEEAERVDALEHVVAIDPGQTVALSELALGRSRARRHAEAVEWAERAVSLAPYDARVLASCAAVLAAAGQCARAVTAQRRALEMLPPGAPDALLRKMRAGLERYQRCEVQPVAQN